MKYLKQTQLIYYILIVGAFALFAKYSYSASTDYVRTKVKIGVCGNSVVEDNEDCEGNNHNGKSCVSLGYDGGALSCDPSCSFDTTNCITNEHSQEDTEDSDDSDDSEDSTSRSRSTSQQSEQNAETSQKKEDEKPKLPRALSIFDPDGDGKINLGEISKSVEMWVGEWRKVLLASAGETEKSIQEQTCDLNNDLVCNVKDFSILMSYVTIR